ncbi:transposase domain-containing protein [Tepidicaulis sp. LMO-SS28]|uniref:transposase domain-containing protein n=1 Tax=Tepidicaulis sp. LMO-SS28 TaxID=3447455 RepID=UPI003EDEE048
MMETFAQKDNPSWLTAEEIAALNLPGLPSTKRKVNELAKREGWKDRRNAAGELMSRRRKGRGGGFEYQISLLPMRAQVALLERSSTKRTSARVLPASSALWDWYNRQPDAKKSKAEARLRALNAVFALEHGGMIRNLAVHEAAKKEAVSPRTVYNWLDLVAGAPRSDWLPLLCPRHVGRTQTVECDPRAWQTLLADYLRQSQRPFEICYEDLKRLANQKGWSLPSARTLKRRIEQEIPKPVRVLHREGPRALARMYPPQERDRSALHALEAVNVDGHKFDVFVRWPDGTIGRVILVAIQDLYSNKILAWRVDRTENTDLVRLAFKDVFETFGIPDRCLLDNGRAFASKYITGGTPNRFRFKVKPEEPVGILTALGIILCWATPYSGQSKPIERAFRELCDRIAKHPACEGAYTGNSPEAKPENYGSRAIDLDDFLQIVEQGIRFFNAKPGRRTKVCGGTLSFDDAFERSYAQSVIRKAGPEQLQMCLLAAESVRPNKLDGSIRLLGNRYWAECLHDYLGKPVTVRFDPDNLHDGVHIYRPDGSYVGFAECIEAAGFFDAESARTHARDRRAFVRKTKELAAMEKQLSASQLADLYAGIEVEDREPPSSKVVRAVVGNTARKEEEQHAPEEDFNFSAAFSAGLKLLQGGKEL